MSVDISDRLEGTVRIPLFGYFCVEIEGQETILVQSEPSGLWSFPIKTEFDPRIQSTAEAINLAVLDFCERSGLFGPAELLASDLELPAIRNVFIGPSPYEHRAVPEGTAGIFFKVSLRDLYGASTSDYKWESKKEIFASPAQCADQLELAAINRSFVYQQFGFKVIECVDVLVFRIKDKQPEFLLLKREDPLRGFWGREYPKGPILFHETMREGALHRLMEETGTTSYEYRDYFGYQVVDVRERKLVEYDALRVHGFTFLFTGTEDAIQPVDTQVVLRDPIWVSWEQAREMIWMKPYGPEFFDRWKAKQEQILSGLV